MATEYWIRNIWIPFSMETIIYCIPGIPLVCWPLMNGFEPGGTAHCIIHWLSFQEAINIYHLLFVPWSGTSSFRHWHWYAIIWLCNYSAACYYHLFVSEVHAVHTKIGIWDILLLCEEWFCLFCKICLGVSLLRPVSSQPRPSKLVGLAIQTEIVLQWNNMSPEGE